MRKVKEDFQHMLARRFLLLCGPAMLIAAGAHLAHAKYEDAAACIFIGAIAIAVSW